MKKKQYKSYKEIDENLEILKLEKEISYQKVLESFATTKENLQPKNILGTAPRAVLSVLGFLSSPVKDILISFILKKILK